MRGSIARTLTVVLFLGTLNGCAEFMAAGPTTDSPAQRAMAVRTAAVERARTSLEAAKTAGCESAAPFEYYMAQEYLQLAEHELGGGDKEGVVEFAEKSNAHSMKAIEMAKGEKR